MFQPLTDLVSHSRCHSIALNWQLVTDQYQLQSVQTYEEVKSNVALLNYYFANYYNTDGV